MGLNLSSSINRNSFISYYNVGYHLYSDIIVVLITTFQYFFHIYPLVSLPDVVRHEHLPAQSLYSGAVPANLIQQLIMSLQVLHRSFIHFIFLNNTCLYVDVGRRKIWAASGRNGAEVNAGRSGVE